MKRISFALAALLCAGAACADTLALDLGRYGVTGNYALPTLNGLGLEASAVTYARDRGTLFVVGDEGLGVIEYSRTGTFIGSMAFDWSGTNSSNNDAEGLTYANGKLVVVDERPQIAYQFEYSAGGTVALNGQPKVAITGSTTSVGNVGTEGISYDPLTGGYFTVKQDNPAELRFSQLTFAVGFGSATTSTLFSGAAGVFGLNSLSDVQTLSGVDTLAGQSAASNLLILSLDSRKLVEINRSTGAVLSSLDLAPITTQAIEGVTIDENGVIYLVAEDSGTGSSRLFVVEPVPEPGTWALMASGLAILAWRARRRRI